MWIPGCGPQLGDLEPLGDPAKRIESHLQLPRWNHLALFARYVTRNEISIWDLKGFGPQCCDTAYLGVARNELRLDFTMANAGKQKDQQLVLTAIPAPWPR